jgi:ribonuclease VapC
MRLVVDTSALLAVLLREAERDRFIEVLLDNEPVMSVATLTESYLVARGRLGADVLVEVDRQIESWRIEIAPVLADDRVWLRQALLDFGKGRGQDPAVLNFGDLFAYALARRLGLPLLFKGEDFARTDVRPAFTPPLSSEVHEPADD